VKRIPGISMSIEEFMNTPSRQISYLLDMEYKIIEHESEERQRSELQARSTSRTGVMVPNKHKNSKEAELAIESYIRG